jgi:cytochrome b subunit of formate dehydrogenase
VLVAGHIYLAVLHPATRGALRGMTLGDVDRDWASRHHAKWVSGGAEHDERAAEAERERAVAAQGRLPDGSER